MISTPKNIRITQVQNNSEEYLLYNSITGEEYNIDSTMLEIIKVVNEKLPKNRDSLLKIVSELTADSEEIIDFLLEEGIWTTVDGQNPNILTGINLEYPLATITIELTNICTLNCIHCYGKFGHNNVKYEYSIDDIKKLKEYMDMLSVRTVVLTGGDAFLNRNITSIAKFLLENGFKVSILSNGWHDISLFCDELAGYKYSMVFSIDGMEAQHDYIRGRKESFSRAIKALTVATNHHNVTTKVNVTVMKNNINGIGSLIEYLKTTFPQTTINTGMIIPVNDNNIDFAENEFEYLDNKCSMVFDKFIKDKEREKRCQGGISLCSLDANGNVTICTAARERDFILGNIYERTLFDIWMNPSPSVEKMRKEFHQQHKKCDGCAHSKKCRNIQDCRVYALKYTGSINNPSPICCYVASKERVR